MSTQMQAVLTAQTRPNCLIIDEIDGAPTVSTGGGAPTVSTGGGAPTVSTGGGAPTVSTGGGAPTVSTGNGRMGGALIVGTVQGEGLPLRIWGRGSHCGTVQGEGLH